MRDRSIVLVVRHNKILSVRTYRHGDYFNELPGGGIELGETPFDEVLRRGIRSWVDAI